MGIELVWKAVLQWPVLLLGWLLGMRAIGAAGTRAMPSGSGAAAVAFARAAHLAASTRAVTPVAAVVVPVAVSMAVQESIAPSEVFTHFPAGMAYGALPPALLAAALVAVPLGCGTGRLGAWASAIAVPAAAFVLLRPPGLRDGGPQLLAVAAASLGALAPRAGASPATRRAAALPFASWWLLFALASGMVLLSGFAKLAIALGALSATAATLAVAAFAGCAPVLTNGTAACLATAFVACIFVGQGYDEAGMPRAAWWLLSFAPAASVLGRIPALRSHPRLAAALEAGLPMVLAIVALAVALAAIGLPGSAAPGDEGAYGLAAP